MLHCLSATCRYRPHTGLLEAFGKQGSSGIVHADGFSPLALGDNRIEIDEPGLEEGLCHGLEGAIHPAVQFDLIVNRTENARDGFLLVERRKMKMKLRDGLLFKFCMPVPEPNAVKMSSAKWRTNKVAANRG